MTPSADEREAGTEYHQKFLDVIDQTGFQIAFDGVVLERQEVEQVWVFERLLNQVGLRLGQRRRKVADGLSLPTEQVAFDLHRQNGPAPTMLDGFRRVPES